MTRPTKAQSMIPGRLAWLKATLAQVVSRLERAETAHPGTDPIGHRLDEYRACIAELDAWIIETTRLEGPQRPDIIDPDGPGVDPVGEGGGESATREGRMRDTWERWRPIHRNCIRTPENVEAP